MKHRAIGLMQRYSQGTEFVTISPNNRGNARGVRLCYQTTNNKNFPSDFEPGCPFGEDGEDFLSHMVKDSTMISEGFIALPGYISGSERAALGNANPIAFVYENKRLLFDILDILFGLTPANAGFFSKAAGSSRRRTHYYRKWKGIFGHALSGIGVTEDHARGSLHWHLILMQGICAYAKQRFANLPELCATMSEVLNQVHQSELSAETHAATILRRLIIKKRKEWEISQSVAQSVTPPDGLLDHPNMLEEVKECGFPEVCAPIIMLQNSYKLYEFLV